MRKKSNLDYQTSVINLFIQSTTDKIQRIKNANVDYFATQKIIEIEQNYIEEFCEKLKRIL
jgi:hypothetical protein